MSAALPCCSRRSRCLRSGPWCSSMSCSSLRRRWHASRCRPPPPSFDPITDPTALSIVLAVGPLTPTSLDAEDMLSMRPPLPSRAALVIGPLDALLAAFTRPDSDASSRAGSPSASVIKLTRSSVSAPCPASSDSRRRLSRRTSSSLRWPRPASAAPVMGSISSSALAASSLASSARLRRRRSCAMFSTSPTTDTPWNRASDAPVSRATCILPISLPVCSASMDAGSGSSCNSSPPATVSSRRLRTVVPAFELALTRRPTLYLQALSASHTLSTIIHSPRESVARQVATGPSGHTATDSSSLSPGLFFLNS